MAALDDVPTLRQRVLPLVIFGWIVAAIRLALDAGWPEATVTWYFGLFVLMPVAIAVIGLRGRWGPIPWLRMAGTMVVVALLVWGIGNAIAYTVAQFAGWQHGRFAPGVEVVGADGTTVREGGRSAPLQDTAIAKLGVGLLHGLLSSVAASVWCTVFGTLLVWLPARLRGTPTPRAA